MAAPASWPQAPAVFPMTSASNHPASPPFPWSVMAKGFSRWPWRWEGARRCLAEIWALGPPSTPPRLPSRLLVWRPRPRWRQPLFSSVPRLAQAGHPMALIFFSF